MYNYSYLIARFISAIASWLDSGNLRNRLYLLKEENEILRLALDDIVRMDPTGRSGWLAKKTLDHVEHNKHY